MSDPALLTALGSAAAACVATGAAVATLYWARRAARAAEAGQRGVVRVQEDDSDRTGTSLLSVVNDGPGAAHDVTVSLSGATIPVGPLGPGGRYLIGELTRVLSGDYFLQVSRNHDSFQGPLQVSASWKDFDGKPKQHLWPG